MFKIIDLLKLQRAQAYLFIYLLFIYLTAYRPSTEHD